MPLFVPSYTFPAYSFGSVPAMPAYRVVFGAWDGPMPDEMDRQAINLRALGAVSTCTARSKVINDPHIFAYGYDVQQLTQLSYEDTSPATMQWVMDTTNGAAIVSSIEPGDGFATDVFFYAPHTIRVTPGESLQVTVSIDPGDGMTFADLSFGQVEVIVVMQAPAFVL